MSQNLGKTLSRPKFFWLLRLWSQENKFRNKMFKKFYPKNSIIKMQPQCILLSHKNLTIQFHFIVNKKKKKKSNLSDSA